MIDGAAGDRIAFLDGPLDRGDTAVPRQQRGVIADAAESRGRQRFPGHAGVAVGGDDQIGVGCDFGGDHEFRVGLHSDLDTRGLGRGGQPVFAVVNDDAHDIDPVLAQHVEGRHAEVAGTDKRNPHVLCPWLVRPICR